MVQVIVIALFVALHIHDAAEASGKLPHPLAPGPAAAAALLPLAALALLAHAVCVAAGRAADRRGSLRAVFAAERFVRITRWAATAHYAASVLLLGWLDAVRAAVGDGIFYDEFLCALPMLLFLAAGWWSLFPNQRRIREAAIWRSLYDGRPLHPPPGRARYVWGSVRHQILMVLIPVGLVSAWEEAINMHPEWFGRAGSLADGEALRFAGVLAVFLLTPVLMRRVWDTVPIGPGPFRAMLEAMCRRHGVRMRTPLLWRTDGSMVNGAVLGLVWPFRYLLFTDALLDRLSARQVEAVAAHEVGHIRRRHILWLGVTVVGGLLTFGWVAGYGAEHAGLGPDAAGGAALAASLATVAAVFGFVSRRFEWQADAFAAQHLSADASPPAPASPSITLEAVEAMTSALLTVAAINGIDPDRHGWRHGSIAERTRRLHALVGVPVDAAPIDRQAAAVKAVAAITLLLGAALTAHGVLTAR